MTVETVDVAERIISKTLGLGGGGGNEGPTFVERPVFEAHPQTHWSFTPDTVHLWMIVEWGSMLKNPTCGARCECCFMNHGGDNEVLRSRWPTLKEVQRNIGILKAMDLDVNLYGSDILFRADLFGAGLMLDQPQVSTSGHLIATNPDYYLGLLAESRVRKIQMTLHNSSANSPVDLRGAPNYKMVRKAVENIEAYNRIHPGSFTMNLNVVLSTDNWRQTLEYAETAYQLGVQAVRFTRLIPETPGLRAKALVPERELYADVYRLVDEAREKYRFDGARPMGVFLTETWGAFCRRPELPHSERQKYFCPGGNNLFVITGNDDVGYPVFSCLEVRTPEMQIGTFDPKDGRLVISDAFRTLDCEQIREHLGVNNDRPAYTGCHGFDSRVNPEFRAFLQSFKQK